jgi:hypothetical protein
MSTRAKKTYFARLPASYQKPITWGCECSFCKQHPDRAPMWDTLATDGVDTWVVHHPEQINKTVIPVTGH